MVVISGSGSTRCSTLGKVPEECFLFSIGGYQVCDQWLKDRIARSLSYTEIETFQKVVKALALTIEAMGALERELPTWPL